MRASQTVIPLYLFLLLATVILLVPHTSFAAPTDELLALDVAEAWLDERNSRLEEQFDRTIVDVSTYKDEDGEQLYFVVNLEPEGHIIISTDDLIEPIIAFSSTGAYFEDANNPLTTLVQKDMKGRKDLIRGRYFSNSKSKNLETKLAKKQNKSKSKWDKYENKADKKFVRLFENTAPTVDETSITAEEQLYAAASVSEVEISPLLQTKWNQLKSYDSNFNYLNLYNLYTPNNYYSGCVATAISQVLRYHSYPTTGIGQISQPIYINNVAITGTTRGGDGNGGAYDWSIMTPVPSSGPYSANSWNMIGALMYDAGVAVNMMYSSSGSGAYMSKVATAFTNTFQYANAQRTYAYDLSDHSALFEQILNSNLNGGYPVILGIVNTSSNGAHAVVADGYGYDSNTLYHHINMGWGGNSDAWYNLPTIGSYNTTPELIYNIFPNQTGEIISGKVIDQVGTPRAGILVRAQSQQSGATYSDTTDNNGYYGIVVPANDTYDLTAGTVTVSGYAVTNSTISSTANLIDTNITIADTVASDNKADLLWQNKNTGQVLTWLMNGTTSAESLVQGSIWSSMPAEWQMQGMGDFDGDGKDDILWKNINTGMLFIWCLNDLAPANQLSQGILWDSMPAEWQVTGIGDFDGDGKDDILWKNINTGMLFIWLLNGTQQADQLTQGILWNSMPAEWQVKGIADFDGDGKEDILWRNISTGMVYLWCLNGVQQANLINQGAIWDSMPSDWVIDSVGDFDGDGKSDILWRNINSGQLFVWLLNGTSRADTIIQGELWSSMPAEWQTTAVGDFDGDGKEDLLWRNINSGQILVWLMNGVQSASQLSQATIVNGMPKEWQILGVGNVNGQ